MKSSSVFRWSSLRTNSNSNIIAGSRGVARVRECLILSVNLSGQQQNNSFDVTEIVSWLEFADVIFGGTSDRENTSAFAGYQPIVPRQKHSIV